MKIGLRILNRSNDWEELRVVGGPRFYVLIISRADRAETPTTASARSTTFLILHYTRDLIQINFCNFGVELRRAITYGSIYIV